MRVLHVNYTDLLGYRFNGGAIVSWLRDHGHEANYIVGIKASLADSISMFPSPESAFGKFVFRWAERAENALSVQSIFYPQSFFLRFNSAFLAADIVHYHVIHNHFFSYMAFPWLTSAKPSVWSLHDPWALTGHCVHPFECTGWKSGCNPCPYLDYPFPLRQDRAWLNYKLKSFAYRHSKFDLVVASNWMKELVAQSPLLGSFPTHHVPFGLDLNVFSPSNKSNAKRELSISDDKIVIGLRALEGPYKGYQYSLAALEALPSSLPIHVLTCQSRGLFESIRCKFPITDLGEIHGDLAMSLFFNASDIHLMPSMAESYGMMAMEAAACGVPSIVFTGTPLAEICFAPVGGIAVKKGDVKELIDAITHLVRDEMVRMSLGCAARELATKHYDIEGYLRKMVALYESILEAES